MMLHIIDLLLVLAFCPGITYALNPVILFTLQSQDTPVERWFKNFTLCFAPLIAHLVGGVNAPVVIPSHSKSPSWWAYLPHFNPVSVIWRWYAIADRRARASSWDATDMAACNAVFWDADKARWDGSENIMLRSRAWIIKIPQKKHASLLSSSSFTTLILAFQGVQAGLGIYSFPSTSAAQVFGDWDLTSIFIPISIMGLFRLPAAFWLSNDYVYWHVSHESTETERGKADMLGQKVEEKDGAILESGPCTSKEAMIKTGPSQFLQLASVDKPRVQPVRTKIGILYRIWWLASMNGVLVPAAVNAAYTLFNNPPSFPYFSLTNLLLLLMYFLLSTSAILIVTTNVLLGRTHTTIIPCIHAAWYKVLTLVLAAIALATLIAALLETRQLADGSLTTLPEFQCNGTTGACVPVALGLGNANI